MISGPFSLAQLSRLAGLSVEDVRRYTDLGVLQPPRRRRGRAGDSGFHREHVERLRFITRALAYGFTIEDVRRLVDPYALVTCNDVYSLGTHRLEEMQTEQGDDAPAVTALQQLLAVCPRKGGRGNCDVLTTLQTDRPKGG